MVRDGPFSSVPELDTVVDELIATVGPSAKSLDRRLLQSRFVKDNIKAALSHSGFGVVVAEFGSVPLRTFLADADVDMAVIARDGRGSLLPEGPCEDLLDDIHAHFNSLMVGGSAQCVPDGSPVIVSSVSLVPSRIRVLKISLSLPGNPSSLLFDITVNKLAGTQKLPLIEFFDSLVGRFHLFKRSLILIKAWCSNESRLLGGSKGLLTTYAVEVMVMCVFSTFSGIGRPLQVLYKFLDFFSNVDFLAGVVTANGWRGPGLSEIQKSSPLPEEWLDQFSEIFSFESLTPSSPSSGEFSPSSAFQMRPVSIQDPLNDTNNLGRSVSGLCFGRLQAALRLGLGELDKIIADRDIYGLRDFFKISFEGGIITDRWVPRPCVLLIPPNPPPRLYPNPSVSVSSFASHAYSILQGDISEIVHTFIAAHPEGSRMERNTEICTRFLEAARRDPRPREKKVFDRRKNGRKTWAKERKPGNENSSDANSPKGVTLTPVDRKFKKKVIFIFFGIFCFRWTPEIYWNFRNQTSFNNGRYMNN